MPPVTPENQRRAEILQLQANQLCELRQYGGVLAGLELGISNPSWPLGVFALALAYTDKIDGNKARESASLLQKPTTPAGGELDHIADKFFAYGVLGGIVMNELKNRELKQAMLIGIIGTTWAVRDVEMAKTRKIATQQGLDTKAQTLSKIKTAVTLSTLVLATSPISKTKPGRTVRNTGLLIGTALSLASYRRFKNNMSDKSSKLDQNRMLL